MRDMITDRVPPCIYFTTGWFAFCRSHGAAQRLRALLVRCRNEQVLTAPSDKPLFVILIC